MRAAKRFFEIRSISLAIVFAVLPAPVPIILLYLTKRIIREYTTNNLATNHIHGRPEHANVLAIAACPHARFCFETNCRFFHSFLHN